MQKGCRIISIEAADIYKHEQEYGVAVVYKLPDVKSDPILVVQKQIGLLVV